jgi:hypothetical protein
MCGTRATLGDLTAVDRRILPQLQGLLKKPTNDCWHKITCTGEAAAAATAARRAAALLAASSKHATRFTTQQVAAVQPPQRRAYKRVSEAEQLGGEVPSSGSRRTSSTSSMPPEALMSWSRCGCSPTHLTRVLWGLYYIGMGWMTRT